MWVNSSTGAYLRTHSELRQDAQRVSFPGVITDEMIAAHGYVVVAPTIPSYDPATQAAVELAPVDVGGTWTQQWLVSSLSAQEIADKAAQAKTTADATAAKADAKLSALGNLTPAQVRAWVQANVSSLADAKDVLATLAVAVSILSRRL